MSETKKVEYLIVDTSAFIRNTPLQDIGINIITEEDVVNEVKSKRQLRRLVVLPYDLSVQNAHAENMTFVTEFAKKTGDYASLSATDIKVIALTYQLHKEKVGIENLKSEPTIAQTIDSSVAKAKDLCTPLAGFYKPQKKKGLGENALSECSLKRSEEDEEDEEESDSSLSKSSSNVESDYETAGSDAEQNRLENLSDKFSKLNCESTVFVVQDKNNTPHDVDDILIRVKNDDGKNQSAKCSKEDDGDEGGNDDEGDDDDDSGWITPGNISNVKRDLDSDLLEQKPVTVACLTMDFAMQNVLKQIGLNVVALDGRVIKQMRTFIFRCYACFKTTSIMTKVFCPNCGNKTLKKVVVTLNEEGKQQIHINFRRPISKKGKRFALPTPKGGKHGSNPIVVEDQPVPDQRPTRLARTKNDPLQEDYIAGYSPFITRDVYSKSAMLGIRPGGSFKYWMKRNPNECRKKRK